MTEIKPLKLTLRQKSILSLIGRFFREKGYYPALRDLNQLLKIKSSNTTFSHIGALERKGYLQKNSKGKIISITLPLFSGQPSDQQNRPVQNQLLIPFYSSGAPAGPQSAAEDFPDESLRLDQYLIRNPAQTFALKVRGNSMEKAGIMPEDILLVEKRNDARPGQIIVAHLPSGFTVKRLLEEHGQLYLKSESTKNIQIKLEEGTQIWGVVTGIVRKY